eukprot:4860003-Amphidinium_carterae.1
MGACRAEILVWVLGIELCAYGFVDVYISGGGKDLLRYILGCLLAQKIIHERGLQQEYFEKKGGQLGGDALGMMPFSGARWTRFSN